MVTHEWWLTILEVKRQNSGNRSCFISIHVDFSFVSFSACINLTPIYLKPKAKDVFKYLPIRHVRFPLCIRRQLVNWIAKSTWVLTVEGRKKGEKRQALHEFEKKLIFWTPQLTFSSFLVHSHNYGSLTYTLYCKNVLDFTTPARIQNTPKPNIYTFSFAQIHWCT
jgi:hypothetical protein